MLANEQCLALPSNACQRCQIKKNKCSLMVPNPGTGKTDRRMLEEEYILKHRIEQTEELRQAGIKKGKQRARGSPDAGEPEGSGAISSPSAALSALGSLALESGGSSAVDTPSISPASLPQPSLPKVAAPSPPIAPTARPRRAVKRPPVALESGGSSAVDTPSISPASLPQPSLPEVALPSPPIAPAARPRRAGKYPSASGASSIDPPVTAPAEHLAVVTVEVPPVSQFLKPSQPSHSRSDTSQASDGGSNSARIAALEKKVDELQKMYHDHERRLKEIGA